jgi:hypothetical protein
MILAAILAALLTWRICHHVYVVRPRQAALREVSNVIRADLLLEGERARARAQARAWDAVTGGGVVRDLKAYRQRREGPGAA